MMIRSSNDRTRRSRRRVHLPIMIIRSHSLSLYLCLLFFCVSLVLASERTSFCKCTCFSNSTIIQLGEPTDKNGGGLSILNSRDLPEFLLPREDDTKKDDKDDKQTQTTTTTGTGDDKKFRALTCNDCNRKLCLDYDLPKCKGASEQDVFTTCFQRDSGKDQAVVFIFIIATVGLLIWALVKPLVDRYLTAARERRSYLPVSAQEEEER